MNYHIHTQAEDKKTVNVVFHVPVPATGANEASVQWRDAVVAEKGGSDNISSVLPGIDPTELTQLKAGALIEVPKSMRFSSINLTPAQKKAEIVAEFNMLTGSDPKSSVLAAKQIILEWIGYAADVS